MERVRIGLTLKIRLHTYIKIPNVTTAILGATKKQQLEENLKALQVLPMLSSEVLEKIEAILQNKPVMDLA